MKKLLFNIRSTSKISALVILMSFVTACSKDVTTDTAGTDSADTIGKVGTEAVVDALDLDHEDVFSLTVGSCFDDDGDEEEISSVPMRECTEPHDNEVYFLYDLPDGEYPVDDEPMYEKCVEEFDKFVGIAYEDSIYDYDIMTPTQYSWDEGEREIFCYIYEGEFAKIDKPLKGSKE